MEALPAATRFLPEQIVWLSLQHSVTLKRWWIPLFGSGSDGVLSVLIKCDYIHFLSCSTHSMWNLCQRTGSHCIHPPVFAGMIRPWLLQVSEPTCWCQVGCISQVNLITHQQPSQGVLSHSITPPEWLRVCMWKQERGEREQRAERSQINGHRYDFCGDQCVPG